MGLCHECGCRFQKSTTMDRKATATDMVEADVVVIDEDDRSSIVSLLEKPREKPKLRFVCMCPYELNCMSFTNHAV